MDFLKNFFGGFLTDQKSQMKASLTCAQCNDQELKVREKFGVKAYICYNCGGSFLTQESLNNLLNFQEKGDWPELFDMEVDTEHTYDRSVETRRCPGCSSRMENMEFRYTSGIWVDYCPDGHGVWLDSGEMGLIKEHHKSIDLNEPMSRDEMLSMARSYKTVDHKKDPTYKIVESRKKMTTGMQRERERHRRIGRHW